MKVHNLVVMFTFAFLLISCINVDAKTFTCKGGIFSDLIGLHKGSVNGQCVLYVRYETGILPEGCSGEAWTCYQGAINAGYAVGQTPKVSSIIVFNKDSTKTGLGVGHVGIVKEVNGNTIKIRDSNWTAAYTVGEHSINITDYNVLGYIYCDGVGADSDPVLMNLRVVGDIGWYPPTKTCVNAEKWFRVADYNGVKRAVQSFANNAPCFFIDTFANGVWYDVVFGSSNLPSQCSQ